MIPSMSTLYVNEILKAHISEAKQDLQKYSK